MARALIHQREILIVDEALSGLDNQTAQHLMRIIMEYPGTVIDIEHHISPEIAAQFNKKLLLKKA